MSKVFPYFFFNFALKLTFQACCWKLKRTHIYYEILTNEIQNLL